MEQNGLKIMRIAHLIYSPALGGSEMYAAEICAHLDRDCYEPIVLFMYPYNGPMPDLLKQRGIQSFHLNNTRFSKVFGPFLLAYKLAKFKIDVLHVHHIPLLRMVYRAAKIAGIKKVIFTEHAKYSITKSNPLQMACRRAAEKVNHFTVVSENLKRYFTAELGIKENKITIVYNGVDIGKYRPGVKNGKLHSLIPFPFNGPVLIAVGRLADAKDYNNLFYAMKSIESKPSCPVVVIIGDGELKNDLTNKIKELNLETKVILAGRHTNISELLLDADAFVISSKREGLPTSLLEAMSCGLPVIATNVGGIPEVVNDNYNGYLVPAENSTALAGAIERLCITKDTFTSLGKNARKTIEERFSFSMIAQQFMKMYTE